MNDLQAAARSQELIDLEFDSPFICNRFGYISHELSFLSLHDYYSLSIENLSANSPALSIGRGTALRVSPETSTGCRRGSTSGFQQLIG
jgi:hypothetical protein